MSNLLDSAMFFEATMAMCLMMRNLQLENSETVSAAVLCHTNNAIAKLRKCLLEPNQMYSDLVLMTIFPIATVHV